MEVKDLRNQSPVRLLELANELRAKIRDLRFTVGTRQSANVRDFRKAKRDLARILTIRNEKMRTSV
ncbi:50S ribosomal protein L29 [Candidatus Uhrbacteria bacterium RIFCSPHIGHO2_12_FULL_60_25]|uniref:Large ribosomal subunit protein uL29 n=1 Tax=Candidatus Uhrbacteria bacterium RIFCSPHIGHO2_12_FULL_60_25 TaxID=1802399 RepID=A0A1F7ULS4_9BACT|nr:MAG: 50S ribosomal protein L29 [Candidatus Uhrbacteria bacterium RIFCSPHIGHO2_02_FULL_60_44]OGL79226.1 MAG: 50S ribosomal protein L29 [Candidatus Uhrbacteria bacterium RIFCSPHIGHO2_12_FULL_60_25]